MEYLGYHSLSVLSLVNTIHKFINHYYVHIVMHIVMIMCISICVFIKILEDRKSFEIVL